MNQEPKLIPTWLPVGWESKQVLLDIYYIEGELPVPAVEPKLGHCVAYQYNATKDTTQVVFRPVVPPGEYLQSYVYSLFQALVPNPYTAGSWLDLPGKWDAESLSFKINQHWYNRDDLEAHKQFNGTIGRAWEPEEVVEHYAKQLNAMAVDWAETPNQTPLERTQGMVHSTLAMLSGNSLGVPGARFILSVADEDREYHLERGQNFYVPGMEIDPYDINNACNRLRNEATSGMPKD